MSNWWDSAPVVNQPQAPAQQAAPVNDQWWSAAPPVARPDRAVVDSGSLLPISRYNDGTWGFDSNAGIVGSIKRALTLPGDVYTGKTDPMSPEGLDRAMDLAGLATPVNPAVRVGDRAIPGVKMALEKRMPKAPTREQLRATAGGQYKTARDANVDFSADAVANMAASTQRRLEADGVIDEIAPKTHRILGKLQAVPDSGNPVVNLNGLEAARRSFSKGPARDFASENAATERGAARSVIQSIDDFLRSARRDETGVVAGAPAPAIDTLTAARGNHAAAKRSETLEGITEAATRRAAASHSGQNIDNTLRGRVASALERPKVVGGFDDAERAALEAVAQGTPVRNATRFVGNVLAGGGGVGMTALGLGGGAAGAATLGPMGAAIGAAVPVIGFGARQAANSMTDRALMKAAEQTRKRSPLYREMVERTPMTPVSPEQRAFVLRLLMQGMAEQSASPINGPAQIQQPTR